MAVGPGRDAQPEVLTTADGLDYERITALDPDLIIGTNAGLDEESYGLLSAIAPTMRLPGATRSGLSTLSACATPAASNQTPRVGPREVFMATCAGCGKQTDLPFKPRGDRPVYCSDCFGQQRR